ncbi:NAD-dependent epimerase/dehydratase family protein [Methylocystis sp. JAN1]|uniref:NAD-dependent epimerase/dehydratase family protein n=1 Tax=Methylocystis sp. JAN1 TaxID=3397211 RepID=UPI003FA22AF8
MRVFLTGATGFLGGEIARRLVARGHRVAALVRGGTKSVAGAEIVPGDFFDLASYREAMSEFRPEALLHCGWRGVAGAERNELYQLDNIVASGNLFAVAADCGARRLVGVGSQGEYGPKRGRISENNVAEPTTLYGIAKLAAARTLFNICAMRGVSGAWGRVFSLYGPGDVGPWLIPSLIRAFREGRPPELTRCEQVWEYTHVRDAADAMIALLETQTAEGLFNVGSSEPIALRDLVLKLRDMIAPSIEPKFGAVPYRPDQVMHLEADIERLRGATGWRPRIPLDEGLRETIAAFEREAA